jgi:lipoprotein-releasing system permease protein
MAFVPFQTERFLARRYLAGAEGRPEGRRFLRFVTYVAVGGVAVGVAALLLAFSIVRGFSREIENKIIGFGAHVQVESLRDAPLGDAEALALRLAGRDGVDAVSPVVQEFVLLRRSSTRIEGISIWGTDRVPDFIGRSLVAGSSDLSDDSDGARRIVVGARLARQLDVAPGDQVTAFSVGGGQASPGRVRVKPFVVAGVFESDLADFDDVFAFVAIDHARDLLSYGPDQVTRFDLTLREPSRADAVAAAVGEDEGFPVMARSIYEVYASLFAWVRLQQQIIPMVIAVIILVAAFNIIGTLLMMMLEKTREIGILMAMGATPTLLRRTFLLLGALIGVTGIVIGEGLALALALLQQRYGIIPLPAEAYFMKTAPIELAALDFVLVAVLTVLLCALAAYLPARFAGRIQPIRAIHFR